MQQFNSDEEIMQYITDSIDSIKLLEECRLYKKEQYQMTEQVMKARNATEWVIRINKVIENFTYAIIKSYEYTKLMEWPLEQTENSKMYSYYLEDAVYRDIVLWDLLRQFLNEFFECGYRMENEISIFSFLNNPNVKQKIGNSKAKKIKKYLNSSGHQEVRTRLRNHFTHSLDSTSSYLFHRVNDKGLLQADMSNVLPRHPYENIVYVLDDAQKYLSFAKLYIEMLEKNLIENIMMIQIECTMKCGKSQTDTESWSINILKNKAEQILVPCQNPCNYAIEYQNHMVCKPVAVNYCRINENDKKYQGKIDLQMDYKEMKAKE